MSVSILDAYAELYHYTTGVGLEAIVRTQQLRATHIAYLNDTEEFVGFFSRRLPRLLDTPLREALAEVAKSPLGKKAVQEAGGFEKAVEELKRGMQTAMMNAALQFHEPFVT